MECIPNAAWVPSSGPGTSSDYGRVGPGTGHTIHRDDENWCFHMGNLMLDLGLTPTALIS